LCLISYTVEGLIKIITGKFMPKADLKTRPTTKSVGEFIDSIADETQRQDSKVVDKLMREVSGSEPKMWGPAIIGYGQENLKYATGRELDWPKLSFSPRKQYLTLYVLTGGEEKYQDLLDKLGKYTTGKVCLYIKRLTDVDMDVLKQIIERSAS
jgi:hypothetical protein